MRIAALHGVAAATLCLSSAAFAQGTAADGRLVYEAGFFATFSPSSALQMVERLPGFVLDSGNSGVRGFGQAAGNVVINGQRPSSKSDTLGVLLSRIPASRVARIEIAPGSTFGADYAGKPQVANVVLITAGGLAGTLEAKLVREFTGSVLPNASASVLYRTGNSSFDASAKLQNYAYSSDGVDRLTALPSGGSIERRDVFSDSREPYRIFSAGWAHESGDDRSAHIAAKVSIDPWDIDQTSQVTLADGVTRRGEFFQRHIWKTYELSGDVTRPLWGGAIKANALATRRRREHDDTSLEYLGGALRGGTGLLLDDQLDERVVRLSWTRSTASGWQIEGGAEGAFNKLSSVTGLFAIDSANVRTRVDLPIDNAVVTEYRGEAFVNAGRALSGSVHVDFGVTFETSRLRVTGDVEASRSLRFLKPNASIDWQSGDWHAQLGITRTVAQLDFADFVSGAEVNDDRVSGGNAELVPQRAWEILLSADRKLLGDGRIKIDLGYDHISLVQDRVPIPGGFDAPGNLGNGTRLLARVNLDVPLRDLGITGGRLSLSGAYNDTAVRDPYTLRRRHFSGGLYSGVNLFSYTANFRQDLGAFAWGVSLRGNTGTTSYRRTELDRYRGIAPDVSAFVEYRPSSRLTAALGVENGLDLPTQRWRTMFTPDRTSPAPVSLEYRERNSHRLWYVSLKRSFGG